MLKGCKHYASKVMKYEGGGSVEEIPESYKAYKQDSVDKENKISGAKDLPVFVRTNGKLDPDASGRMEARNYADAIEEKYNSKDSLRTRAMREKRAGAVRNARESD